MAIIVEIMGLPGSGKTMASAILARALREKRVAAWNRREVVLACIRRRPYGWIKGLLKRLPTVVWEPWLGSQTAFIEYVGFTVLHPNLLKLLADWTIQSGWGEQKRHGILWAFALLFAEAELIRRHAPNDGVVLFDEGAAHRGFSLFGYLPPDRVSGDVISNYVDAIPLPQAVVWMDADVESCMRRLDERSHFPLLAQGGTTEDIRIQLQHGQVVVGLIASALAQKGVPVWRVDNRDGSQAESTERLIRQVIPQIMEIQCPL